MISYFDQIKSAWAEGSDDNIGIIAAGIAYYVLLALVPLLAVTVLGYGLFANPQTVSQHIGLLAENLPAAAAEIIGDQLRRMSEDGDATKILSLLIALGIALFGARNGARAVMTGLNIAFNTESARGFVRGNLIALAITVAAVVGLAVLGGVVAAVSTIPGPAGGVVGFVVLFGFATLGAGLLYRVAPNQPGPEWQAIWPAASLFSLLWIGATAGFGLYAANFASYNATYGSLGGVIVLITWFYLSAFFLLLGAELAAVRSRKAA
ncbi:hypothetical protein A9995_05435 [Erythrobacter sp. QSSC1-22B]|uniref:YihY/virulence factor BrkB family protein n=1 Tax=Erythrobacter sp. QSSC1-22B TaxID=1860125 RepID=UPI000806012F|nr:YihY/virulence factor BrkB family protein [Erythrobacter sp. QSSC1-22B]OBX19980.1 hypothetical protein A9995_05435 [Erythrobacter sp. QSSC1-22B]